MNEQNLRSQLDKASSELETLKKAIKNIKPSGMPPSYGSKEMNNSSMMLSKNPLNVITSFKETLKESERYASQLISLPSPESKLVHKQTGEENEKSMRVRRPGSMSSYSFIQAGRNEINSNNNKITGNMNIEMKMNEDSMLNSSSMKNDNNLSMFINRISNSTIREELERMKVTNQVLNKSNIDLKNMNRLLQMELDSYKTSNVFTSQMSQYDQNLNNFIENLKTSLNAAQMSNQELTKIIETTQGKVLELNHENSVLKDQLDAFKKELETLNKKHAEAKIELENWVKEYQKADNERNQLQIRLREKEEKLNENNEKISSLISINDNYNKTKMDTNDVIENLKKTIQLLNQNCSDNTREKELLNRKIEEYSKEVNSKVYEMECLNEKMKKIEGEKGSLNTEINRLNDLLKAKDNYIEEIQTNYKKVVGDLDKTHGQIETMNIYLEDRDKTIDNMKTSISFLNKTLQEYKNENEKISSKIEGYTKDSNRITSSSELYEKKIKGLEASLQELKATQENVSLKFAENEKELGLTKTKNNQLLFDYDLLLQKYNDQVEFVNKMKNEFKEKKTSEELDLSLFVKNNDERISKINLLAEENKKKTEEFEEMKKRTNDLIKSKDDKIKELTSEILTMKSKEKENENSMMDAGRDLKNENERLQKEMKKMKMDIEAEKVNMNLEKEKLQKEYSNMAALLSQTEQMYKDLQEKDKKIIPTNFSDQKNFQPTKPEPSNLVTMNLKENKTASQVSIQVPFEEYNTQSSNVFLYSIYDSQNILGFHLVLKQFSLLKFEDNVNFNKNFIEDDTLTLNCLGGLFILTGRNSDQMFFFDPFSKSMTRLPSLKYSHNYGMLIYHINTLYVLSGKGTRKVEKLVIGDSRDWGKLPDTIYDRSNAGVIVFNGKYLYLLFGVSLSQGQICNSIERINLNLDFAGSNFQWEEMKFNSQSSTYLKNFFCLRSDKYDEILLFGGYDFKAGHENRNLLSVNFYTGNVKCLCKKEFDNKESCVNFSRERAPISFFDELYEGFFAIFDDQLSVHVFDNIFAQYTIHNVN